MVIRCEMLAIERAHNKNKMPIATKVMLVGILIIIKSLVFVNGANKIFMSNLLSYMYTKRFFFFKKKINFMHKIFCINRV